MLVELCQRPALADNLRPAGRSMAVSRSNLGDTPGGFDDRPISVQAIVLTAFGAEHRQSLGPALRAIPSCRRHSSAVDEVFRTGDGCGPVGGNEGDQVRNLLGLGGTTKRDPAKRLHDDALSALAIDAGVPG